MDTRGKAVGCTGKVHASESGGEWEAGYVGWGEWTGVRIRETHLPGHGCLSNKVPLIQIPRIVRNSCHVMPWSQYKHAHTFALGKP